MRWRSKYAWILAASLFLVACNKSDGVDEAIADDPTEVEEETGQEEVAEELKYKLPFTGEMVAEQSTQRPVLVTINNQPEARPQSGLQQADIVFEMLAEGEGTRLLALYQSEMPETVGPIRSARKYFIDVAKGLDAFYVAHGYSPEAKTMLNQGVVDHINGMQYDGIYFKRASHRKAPHNSYLSQENFERAADKLKLDLETNDFIAYSFYENDENVRIGMAAPAVNVKISNAKSYQSRYFYFEDEGTYERSQGGSLTIDEQTNERLAISNLLFFEIPHRVVDQEGRRELDLTAGGRAYVAQKGMLREVKWENRAGQLVAIESDGSDVLLVPGQTWVHFVPTNPGIATAVTLE